MNPLPLIAARWTNTPLALHPGKAEIIARAFGPRVYGGPVSVETGVPLAGVLGTTMDVDEPEYARPDITQNVAIIPIEGTLCAKGKWVGQSSGSTSYEGIIAQAEMARADPMVRGVVLEVDSFGGEVYGLFECGRVLRRLASEKPMIAILSSAACSAGYALACCAPQITIPETGDAGSIGVISLHVSVAGALEKEGLKVTILAAGARKADLNPYEDLPPEVRDGRLAEMAQIRDIFVNFVAEGRGARLPREAVLATEAATYCGQAAVDAGLADVVADPLEAFAAFVEEINRAG